ncbi:MAG: Gram-negative bacterial TonB protein C-terminal [Verrucomicrobiota bacterium]
MTKALLKRPSSKWSIIAAFTGSAAIHLSAVALASLHHQATTDLFGTPFTEIDVEAPSPDLPAEPQETDLPSLPDFSSSSDFVDIPAPPRTLKKQATMPPRVTNNAVIRTLRAGVGKALALRAPRPEYPYEARNRHITGSGIAILAVDFRTGAVTNATMVQSTGNALLDHSALSAFGRWQFKPATTSQVKIPITFTITGAQL